ncbi:hypothetical protein VTJ04DRAFT_2063 [Mycothermus thermophilus]|uniref:uncharacterized protein n=1 Tax=Humicola insolens TaxID=85995 RepID=UPI003743D62E
MMFLLPSNLISSILAVIHFSPQRCYSYTSTVHATNPQKHNQPDQQAKMFIITIMQDCHCDHHPYRIKIPENSFPRSYLIPSQS